MSINNYILFKQLVAFGLLLHAVPILPFFFRYFGTPYHKDSIIRNRFTSVVVSVLLVTAIVFLMLDYYALFAALFLTISFRYLHIDIRYNTLARGAGAVGFIPYHVCLFITLFEIARNFDSSGLLIEFIYYIYLIDFALIMLCAGLAKALSGYFRNYGVEMALVNPLWCHFFQFYRNIKASSFLFKILNFFGYALELVVGVLLLIPQTREVGAILWIILFSWILLNINLASLPFLMVFIPIVFIRDLNFSFYSLNVYFENKDFSSEILNYFTISILSIYTFLHLTIKIGQYFNVFFSKKVFQPLQYLIDTLGPKIPIFIWRVFNADLTNIFVRISEVDTNKNVERVIINEETFSFPGKLKYFFSNHRYYHVSESVVLSTIFNQLKYNNKGVARCGELLAQYVKTLKHQYNVESSKFLFDVILTGKKDGRFDFKPIVRCTIRPDGSDFEIIELSNNWQEQVKINANL